MSNVTQFRLPPKDPPKDRYIYRQGRIYDTKINGWLSTEKVAAWLSEIDRARDALAGLRLADK